MDALEQLLIKFSRNECTSQELEHLLQHFENDKNADRLKNGIEKQLGQPYEDGSGIDSAVEEVFQKVKLKITQNTLHHTKPKLRLLKYAAAAVVLFFISTGLWYYFNETKSTRNQGQHAQIKTDIGPGSNKAILTLANGSQVVLDEVMSNGEVAKQAGTKITKTQDNQLIYAGTNDLKEEEIVFNELRTPIGGQYSLLLSDGTRVWLNAASSLRFPAVFKGSERKVQLNGEAYFEVAKNKKMPFKVEVNDNTIEVLGTHFNIMAYNNESAMSTTLLEGSVKVYNKANSALIKPNQQANLNKSNNKLQVMDVDASDAIAWKNGYFLFEDENIESIMRKLSRWYNIDVEYKGAVTKDALWGNVSRFKNISEVLKTLELTKTVHFKLDGRRVIVMP